MAAVKTTVEISDALLDEGLRRSLDERRKNFLRLRRASYRGKGLQAGVSSEWAQLREAVYEGRGG
jgi:hypothetical protein